MAVTMGRIVLQRSAIVVVVVATAAKSVHIDWSRI